jgi:hypothetical protein
MQSKETNEMIRARETALNNLEKAYKFFKSVASSLEDGIKVTRPYAVLQ